LQTVDAMARLSRPRVSTPRLALALSTLAALIAGGCSSRCREETPVEGTSRSSVESAAEDVATNLGSVESSDRDGVIDVAPGEALILYENGRVTLVSNRYPRIGLLGKLSREVGFETTRPELGTRSANVTLRLQDATVEEAIAAALTGVAFQIHYVFDAEQKRSVLSRVALGDGGPGLARGAALGRGLRAGGNGREPSRPTRAERKEDVRRADESSEARGGEIDVGLASSDPELRAEAVDRLRPQGEELETLKNLLANDRSPAVRRIAAERLEASEGGTAITALVNALNDPDASVVLAAIDALEFTADTEHLPMILASDGDRHSNPEVREAFVEMIEFLE
jgi:hypothetical protein